MMPADSLVSRCWREIDRRMLTVYGIWAVKTLMHQVTSTRKRKQIASDLWIYEDDPLGQVAPTTAKTADAYLQLLHTYLLALAIAGASPCSPSATNTEDLGTKSTDYVLVPWDILQEYLFRAQRVVRALPDASRAEWLEKADIAERAVWLEKFRGGTMTLGQVIQQVQLERAAHWEVSSLLTAAPATPASNPRLALLAGETPRKGQADPQSAKGKGRKGTERQPALALKDRTEWGGGAATAPLKPGSIATQLKDGTKLCAAFQQLRCQNTKKNFNCPNGVHKCGMVNKRGRVCGIPGHGAKECRSWDK
jgi:hypothetical protein